MRLNLKRLGLLSGKAARVFAMKAELTPQRLDLLHIARRGVFSQRQLGERLCVTHTVVTRLLQALERDGLVIRMQAEYDRRVKLTYVTSAGLARLARCDVAESSRGAQATGEAIWLDEWRYKIARNGLRVDSVLRARAPLDPHALALWNRRYEPKPIDAPKSPPPNDDDERALEKAIRAMGVDYREWLAGRWVRIDNPS